VLQENALNEHKLNLVSDLFFCPIR